MKRYAINAPVEVRNEAVVLLSAWLYQATAQSRNVFPSESQKGPPVNVSRAFLLIRRTRSADAVARPARGGVSVMRWPWQSAPWSIAAPTPTKS